MTNDATTSPKLSSRVVGGEIRISVDGKLIGTVTVDEIPTGEYGIHRYELLGQGTTYQGNAPYVTYPERSSRFFGGQSKDVTR